MTTLERPPFYRLPAGVPRGYHSHDVLVGTPSEGELHRGDTILKIGEHDAAQLSHQDAHNLIKNTGNTVNITVYRGDSSHGLGGGQPHSPGIPVTPRAPAPVAGGVATPFSVAASNTLPRRPASGAATLPRISAVMPMKSRAFTPYSHTLEDLQEKERELVTIAHQPYRTTPLVFPGAKVKRDVPINTSYLRLNANPFYHSSGGHYTTSEVLMKQKVAESVLQRVTGQDDARQMVHKQFNSPIGLYSNQNIEDVIRRKTGVTPEKRRPAQKSTVNYDPMQSDTFRAVHEDEITQMREQHAIQPQTYRPRTPASKSGEEVGKEYLNTLGTPHETIQQSYTFKRLMANVMGECDF